MTPEDRPHGITRYKHGPDERGTEGQGCRCAICRAGINDYHRRRDRLVAYGRWEYPLDAAGTRRRLQALIWNGWSVSALARSYGCTPKSVRKMLAYERVSPATAAAVRALYRELWDKQPPQGTPHERRAVTLARNHAREMGWVPLAAWDAIDDPDAQPVDGWQRSEGRRRERGVLAAEVLELTGPGFGLDLNQAAERLGVVPSTLTSVLARERAKEAATGAANAA